MAREVLGRCNAEEEKRKSEFLRKGEGKVTAGSGKTNYEVYMKLHSTF